MVSVSTVKGVISGVTNVIEHAASPKGVQTVGNIFAQGVKTTPILPQAPQVVFNNRFFKTMAQDISGATHSQISFAGYSDDVLELLTDKSGNSMIRQIKNLFRRLSKGSQKPSMLGLDRATVARLDSLPEEEFLQESINFIFANYSRQGQKIPKELMPIVMRYNLNGFDMAYKPLQNLLMIDAGLKVKNRAAIFGYVKHEFTHMWQAIDIFRTKSLGEKFSKVAAQKLGTIICGEIQTIAALPSEKLAQYVSHPNFDIIRQYRQYLATSPETAAEYMKKVLESTVNSIFNANEQKRIFIINSLGQIAENSERGMRAKLFFQYFKKGTSEAISQDVDKFKKYVNHIAEQQAYSQTFLGTAEYMFPEINRLFG